MQLLLSLSTRVSNPYISHYHHHHHNHQQQQLVLNVHTE
jgi:hypothetical protein